MASLLILICLLGVATCLTLLEEGTNSNEADALLFLRQHDLDASLVCNSVTAANWNFQTNATEFNRNVMLTKQTQGMRFDRLGWERAVTYKWRDFSDRTLRRMFSLITNIGISGLPEDERAQYADLLQSMKTTYSRAKVCRYNPNNKRIASTRTFNDRRRETELRRNRNREANIEGANKMLDEEGDRRFLEQDVRDIDFFLPDTEFRDEEDDDLFCQQNLRLDPDLLELMRTSRNPEELEYVWTEWRRKAGRPLRQRFLELVRLSNRAARFNGFNDTAEMWLQDYESATFERDLLEIWEQVKPLYENLHAYVMRKLERRYGPEHFWNDGTIPAHLLGDMWSQNWVNILDIAVPFSSRTIPDITQEMRRQAYTPARIYRTADDFYQSLGFSPLPQSFWQTSLFEKPPFSEVLCHPSSWDFCNGVDYRVKHCTQITAEDLQTAHHELGHIHYALSYRTQPFLFRGGANPGFHEALGDALSLSAMAPSHLQNIGLIGRQDQSFENDLNFLFKTALEKVAFLPYAYAVEQWRWAVYRQQLDEFDLNTKWWDLRILYQGVSPPYPYENLRTEDDFDPGAKYHIAANIPYIQYFVGTIVMFQIHDELCKAAGHTGPLYTCNIYGSLAAGDKLKQIMSLGKSRPWGEVLALLTDGRVTKLDPRSLLKFFTPLEDWLISENRDEYVGWSATRLFYSPFVQTASAGFVGIMIALFALVILIGLLIAFVVRRVRTKKVYIQSEIPQ